VRQCTTALVGAVAGSGSAACAPPPRLTVWCSSGRALCGQTVCMQHSGDLRRSLRHRSVDRDTSGLAVQARRWRGVRVRRPVACLVGDPRLRQRRSTLTKRVSWRGQDQGDRRRTESSRGKGVSGRSSGFRGSRTDVRSSGRSRAQLSSGLLRSMRLTRKRRCL